jgi:hypothetical protein
MDACQFAIWKSRNVDAKYNNWKCSDFEVSKYIKEGSILFKLKYELKTEIAHLYKINWVDEELVDSCKFSDIDQLLKKYNINN